MMNGLLKQELGFQGYVVSDWGAVHAGVAAVEAGLDMAMPDSEFFGGKLVEAVQNGTLPESRVTDMAIRILAGWYQLNQDTNFPETGVGMPADITNPHKIVDARNSTFKQVIFDGAVESHVLVKNINNTLPLKKPSMLSLFGYSWKSPDAWNFDHSHPEKWLTGGYSDWLYIGFAIASGSSDYQQIAANGTIFSGGGSGATTPATLIAPFEALNAQAYQDGTALFWDFSLNTNPDIAAASDACIVIGNAFSTEGADRPGVRDSITDTLILNVANKCANTIVVFHNTGVRLVDEFIDHPNVKAVIFAHTPGQDSGPALVSLLYGQSNPSGKLPYTVAKTEADYGPVLTPDQPEGDYRYFPQADFSEGVYLDYRHFDANNIEPRFEFGFGLSYTTFNYSNLQINKAQGTNTSLYPTGAVVGGGQADLWDVVANVTATVTNNGTVAGAEAAQLYVGIPGAAAKQLRGFDKHFMNATQSATVSFELTRRDLSIWDVTAQKWLLQSGTYNIYVGSSSRKLPLAGTLIL